MVGECYKWLLVEFEYRFITKNVSIVLEIGNAKRQKQTPMLVTKTWPQKRAIKEMVAKLAAISSTRLGHVISRAGFFAAAPSSWLVAKSQTHPSTYGRIPGNIIDISKRDVPS